ncbi:dipeptidylpeptidase [Geranomyces michiganensis]|nr:dipeptidylpeptidase [Geranomyces michiganensis]
MSETSDFSKNVGGPAVGEPPEAYEAEHQILEWEPLVSEDWLQAQGPTSSSSPSKEELLMKERRRISAQGILTFQLVLLPASSSSQSQSSGLILFPYHNEIYVGEVGSSNQRFLPTPVPNAIEDTPRLDPKLGGSCHHLISFIRDRDLYVATFDGRELRLTWSESAAISHGVAEYIMQEEFRRFTGYWWAPMRSDNATGSYRNNWANESKERILSIRVDETRVEKVYLPRPGLDGETDEYRYPRAGKSNASAELEVLEFDGAFGGGGAHCRRLWGSFRLHKAFPWMEYIVRAGWTPNGRYVHCQLLNRVQSRTALILVPLTLFHTDDDRHLAPFLNPDERIVVLVDERSDTWINVTDVTQFYEAQAGVIEFVWASERDGWRHLYRGILPAAAELRVADPRNTAQVVYPYVELRQLTRGKWTVVDNPVSVDVAGRRVFFTAKADNILESQFYSASLDPHIDMISPRGGVEMSAVPSITRLTNLGRSHAAIVLDASCSVLVDVASSFGSAPTCEVAIVLPEAAPPRVGSRMLLRPRDDPGHRGDDEGGAVVPEVFSFVNSEGFRIHGLLYKPKDYQPGTSHPTILRVYGGPNIQVVTNDYKHPKLSRVHLAVSLGFCVLLVDGRGSSERGLAFEGGIKHRLGAVEVRDQIEALAYVALRRHASSGKEGKNNEACAEASHETDAFFLSDDLSQWPIDWTDLNAAWVQIRAGRRQEPWRWGAGSCIDLDRVAVTGWSYGGYLSLLMLSQFPSIIRMCLAGAPVTNWELYDTAYTERYMGMPADNKAGDNRLLLVHGLQDENVHFKNTQLLIAALVKNNIPHQTQLYPAERHGLRLPHVVEHFETLMFWWLGRYL